MRKLAAALAITALIGGCTPRNNNGDTGAVNDHAGVDTSIRSGTVKDTTVVKADTNVDVDTTKQTDHVKNDSSK
jgi:ABC-type uncharacterized transport system auxiliary subunit